MSHNLLTFVNHACFHLANDHTVLLADPWVEGPVFNNGWSLLDTGTSNAALIRELAALKRNTFIWFSHEHPDHFSVPFVKRLRRDFAGKVTMLFQHTKDKRVVNFLRSNGFDVIECLPGVPVALDNDMRITVFPHADGDSYCLISSGGRHLLNLNDCALSSAAQCAQVKASIAPLCERVDVLTTQFGYANWVGNPFQADLRCAAAAAKLHRIKLQIEAFAPKITVPFASFVAFAHIDNCYMNDHQNTPRRVAQWARRARATDAVRFLQPGDTIALGVDTAESLAWASDAAVEHWERLLAVPCDLLPSEPPATPAQVRAAADTYRKGAIANLLGLPCLLELAGLIKPLVIRIPDIAMTIRVSYLRGCAELHDDEFADISMTSPSAVFLFANEYGFNTTHVNGRFRASDGGAVQRFSRFFMPQNLDRQGYGVQHPLATLRYLGASLISRLLRRLGAMQRHMAK
ncbi:MBL fold metallo-hydrolase [Massilia sp. P8910]|uniref:MBL fold metallo-hydrolase n=1 Tax=Massilia antarctica TaxID=2765360 RepID=UPI001E3420B2|nr:MBL fold metallo-hydrolase [Massilia antarctica]MCE3602088.1 MBL fold metallo-hydrolase [Massilia antarctica]